MTIFHLRAVVGASSAISVDEASTISAATLRAAAVQLRNRGLTDRDISAVLRLSEDRLHDLLGEPRPSIPTQET